MQVEQLKVGYHVTPQEHLFVVSVTTQIKDRGCTGPITVVGSREQGSRISTKTFHAYCQELSLDSFQYWWDTLNNIARQFNISAGEIWTVYRHLPHNIPSPIKRLFQTTSHLDSDLDLAIKSPLPKGVKPEYDDLPSPKGSGLVIEIYPPNDYSYLITGSYSY